MAQHISLGFLGEGFELRSANDLSQDVAPIADVGAAIYAFLFRDGDWLLKASGYFELGGKPPVCVGGYSHLYTGQTYDLARRIKNHLRGDVRTSTLRKSLLSIDTLCLTAGRPVLKNAAPHNEALLTKWLAANGVVAFRRVADS